MATPSEEQAQKLRAVAAEFREFAAQTRWPAYRRRMLDTAVEMDREAARLENMHPRRTIS